MRDRLLTAPKRAADLAAALLAEERFDLVWITLSSSHIAGHWFLDPSRLPQDYSDLRMKAKIDGTLGDAYATVDQALSGILGSLPPETDLMVISPSSMGPSASRTHLLPRMLQAVLSEESRRKVRNEGGRQFFVAPAGGDSCGSPSLGCSSPAGSMDDANHGPPRDARRRLAEYPGVHGAERRLRIPATQSIGPGTGRDCGSEKRGSVLDHIASGLLTFRDPNGGPAVKHVELVSHSLKEIAPSDPFPDLIVHWSDSLPPHLAGVNSPQFGDVPSAGWGSGRTGEHRDEAWALVIPGSSKMKTPVKPPHIMDIAPTVCAVLGVDSEGLDGQPLLEGNPHMCENDGATSKRRGMNDRDPAI